MKVKLIEHTPNPEKLITMAAKLCYSSMDIEEIGENLTEEEISKFLKMLMGSGHTSPLEHCVFSFSVQGCSRITEQQLTRHRLSSYSIQSSRYIFRTNAKFVVPPSIRNNIITNELYLKQMETSRKAYNELVVLLTEEYIENTVKHNIQYLTIIGEIRKLYPSHRNEKYTVLLNKCRPEVYDFIKEKVIKLAMEDARYVLPQALETKLIFTMNLRTLMNFISLRRCKRAQWEIRELASLVIEELRDILPNMIKYLGAPCETGSCTEGKMSCGKPYIKEVRL